VPDLSFSFFLKKQTDEYFKRAPPGMTDDGLGVPSISPTRVSRLLTVSCRAAIRSSNSDFSVAHAFSAASRFFSTDLSLCSSAVTVDASAAFSSSSSCSRSFLLFAGEGEGEGEGTSAGVITATGVGPAPLASFLPPSARVAVHELSRSTLVLVRLNVNELTSYSSVMRALAQNSLHRNARFE